MTEKLVATVWEQITPIGLFDALRLADPTLTRDACIVLLAQVAEETGWHACANWNLGNVKHVPGDGRDWCQFTTTERINGQTVTLHAGEPGTQFRAFTSMAAGAADYLAILKGRFGAAWPFVLAGDPRGFVRQLAAQHYFTASEPSYEAAVVALDDQIAKEIPEEAPLSDVARAAILTAADEIDEAPEEPPPAAT